MKIGIPVKCQNGHKGVWFVEFRGLDAINLGVPSEGKCKCPKHDIGQGYFKDGEPFVVGQEDAVRDVLAERQRQVSAEGWTTDHDDEHDGGVMAAAASAYALFAADEMHPQSQGDGNFKEAPPAMWPWHEELAGRGEGPGKTKAIWWKPTNPRRALVKAGALILAEIERIDRAAAKAVTDDIPDFTPGNGNKARRRAAGAGIDYDAAMGQRAKS